MMRLLVVVVTLLAWVRSAHAFCGFYVSGADSSMFNHATHVVMTRVGTRTVLAMQNNYAGPPQDFAMVVPVPVVLKQDDVKTLPREVFAKIDAMGSPRLVEYWEQDPCLEEVGELLRPDGMHVDVRYYSSGGGGGGDSRHGVTIEARFTVGEYEVVILSAKESTGLDLWLRESGYKIPAGAEPLLRPYVQQGSKFFVAKVNVAKVTFANGMAQLSPLRFHYDTEEATLPIRLGLANSAGTQDLIVTMLGPERFEVANYKNVFIPTNLDVKPEVRDRFGEFYAALFDRAIAGNPRTVVTEYSWDAMGCDPCPGDAIDGNDLGTLGYDVISPEGAYHADIVLTRLHFRYGKGDVRDDLVFRHAKPVAGGREVRSEYGSVLEAGATKSDANFFQARYAIRHRWPGKVACIEPTFGRWGPRPGGTEERPATVAGAQLAFAPRGKLALDDMFDRDADRARSPAPPRSRRGCGCGTEGDRGALGTLLVIAAVLARRRRFSRR